MRLDHFLQQCGLTETGGQAKVLIQSGEISVNGEIETRRRRKLSRGDRVQFEEHEFTFEHDDHDDAALK